MCQIHIQATSQKTMASRASMRLLVLAVAISIAIAVSMVKSQEINTTTSQQQNNNRHSINMNMQNMTSLLTSSTSSPTNPNESNNSDSDCLLLNFRFAHNQMIPKEMQPTQPDCDKECQCYNGKILCQPICGPISVEAPANLACQPELAIQIQEDCCPKWVCPPTEEYALKNFSILPLNSSAVEVNFVLPLFAVGREGKAELNYTGLPLTDPASQSDMPPPNAIWLRRQNIRTANGIFPRQSIKYYMQQLKPNYRYWFKLGVIFADKEAPFDEMLESNIETATTATLNPSTTTTTTTTTTSLPLQTLAPATTSTTTTTTTTPPPQTIAPATTSTSMPPPSPTTSTIMSTPITTTASQPQTLAPVPTTTTTTTSTTITPTIANNPISTPSSTPTTSSTTSIPPTTTIYLSADIIKQSPSDMSYETPNKQQKQQQNIPPCSLLNNNNSNNQLNNSNAIFNNEIDQQASLGISLPWVQQVNVPLQKYASELLLALVCVSLLLLITTFKLFRTSSYGHMAPHAYDNPSFTKLVSFYAQQPNEVLVDENNQNFTNNVILANQKNYEADKLSPLHRN